MVAPINSCSSPFSYDSSPFLFPFFLRIAYLYSKGRLRSADPYSGGAKARGVDSVGAGCPPSFGAIWCACARVKAGFKEAGKEVQPLPIRGLGYRWGVDFAGPLQRTSAGNA